MRLTDLSIKALKPPNKNSVVYADDTLTGFGVRITANNVRSFVLTHGVRRQRQTIGRVGILSLQEARSECSAQNGHLRRTGRDGSANWLLIVRRAR